MRTKDDTRTWPLFPLHLQEREASFCGATRRRNGQRVSDAMLEAVEEKYGELLGVLLELGEKSTHDATTSIKAAVEVCDVRRRFRVG